MAVQNNKGSHPVPIEPSLLEWAEYWYPISWKGVLAGGVITAVGACATIAFLLLQWRTTSIREEQGEWRTSVVEAQTARANADLGTAQADIAKANAQIAEANARAIEARLNLENLKIRLSGRQINEATFVKELEGKPKAPVQIGFVQGDSEAFSIATQLYRGLKGATWEVSDPMPIAPNVMARSIERPPPIADAPPIGIVITMRVDTPGELFSFQMSNEMLGFPGGGPKTPLHALADAITMSLAGGGWVTVLAVKPDQVDAPPPGVLRLLLGPKS